MTRLPGAPMTPDLTPRALRAAGRWGLCPRDTGSWCSPCAQSSTTPARRAALIGWSCELRRMAGPLAEGDEVRYTAAFLRSTGQHIAPEGSRVHRSGRVVRVEDPWLVVDWGDRYQGPWDDLPPGQSRVHPSAVGRAWEARTYDLPVALAWPT